MVPANCPDQHETLVDLYDIDCREALPRPIMEMALGQLIQLGLTRPALAVQDW
jgi:hypothetical protein